MTLRMDEGHPNKVHPGRASRGGVGKLLGLVLAMALAVAAVIPHVRSLPALEAPVRVSVWVLIPLFMIAELLVVHFRFRRDSHTLSLSSIPQVVALFLATPMALVVGQAVGSLLALLLRRQRGTRVLFNVVGFAFQAVVAITVFRLVLGSGDPLAFGGALAAVVAAAAALICADALISLAIRCTGGRLRRKEMLQVLGIGLMSEMLNAGFGFLTVTLAWLRPGSVWLAILPVVAVAAGYQAYSTQRDERARIGMLHNITTGLHEARLIDDAARTTAEGVREMFEAEAAYVVLTPERGLGLSYRTAALHDRPTEIMVASSTPTSGLWPVLVGITQAVVFPELNDSDLAIPGMSPPRRAMVAPLVGSEANLGFVVVADPLSDLVSFTERDRKLLDTVAGRLVVSLENGRLEDSLAELTNLKERLEAVIRSKDQFIASVSHELRTPLTGILGLAQVLNAEGSDYAHDEMVEFLGIIAEQSHELGNIIEDLLVAARADTGTLVVKPTVTDVTAEVETVLESPMRKVAGKQVMSEIDPDLHLFATVDSLRFRQILRNLISNAMRYGGSDIRITAAGGDGRVVIGVRDDGAGVSEEEGEQIFEAYGRGVNASANPASVGLGLSVSRQLARLMDGDVRYVRQDGWTVFEVDLPAARNTAVTINLVVDQDEPIG